MSDDEQENVEHEEHDPSFKPLVELPAVTIPTCEENEDVLYANEHTRLYRFVKPVLGSNGDSPNTSASGQDSAGEWKERGTGELKLLQNRTSLRVRIVMRREKTLKVCANHYLTADMQFDRLQGKLSAQTCLWFTPSDFADGESHPERFCLRFRSADEANEFRQAIERAKVPATSETASSHVIQEDDASKHGKDHPKQGDDKQNEELVDRLGTLTVTSTDKETA